MGIQADVDNLDPLLATNTTDSAVDRLIFDVLVSVDASGNREVPMLAAQVPTLANGGISRDGLTITYHLRHGVRWSDGAPLTSADVAFSFHAIMNDANNVIARDGYDVVRSVAIPDPYTIVFHLKHPYAPFVNTVFGESDSPYAIIPAHLLAKLPNINHIAFNSQPVGTGPFELKEWVRGDHLTLVPNPHYFLGAPKLKEIRIEVIPDENTEINDLRSHSLDWQFEASPDEYRQLKTIPDLRIVLVNMNQYLWLQINNRHVPLDELPVRQAIAMALDKQRLVDDLTGGSASVADQDLPPFSWAHATEITRYPYDPARARALLIANGWKPGPDGILEKNGVPLHFVLATNTSNVTRRAAVVQIQAMLQKVGIAAEIKSYLATLLFASVAEGGILQTGKYDLSVNGWIAGIDPDQSSQFLCSAIPPNGNNSTFYCNPKLDAAEHDALTHYDRATRKAAYARVEAILTHDTPDVVIWWPRQLQPVNPDFRNFDPNPVTETWDAYRWDI